jgi:uncharacterized protein with PIN domain
MIVDTSALVAILRDELDAKVFAVAVADADRRRWQIIWRLQL